MPTYVVGYVGIYYFCTMMIEVKLLVFFFALQILYSFGNSTCGGISDAHTSSQMSVIPLFTMEVNPHFKLTLVFITPFQN